LDTLCDLDHYSSRLFGASVAAGDAPQLRRIKQVGTFFNQVRISATKNVSREAWRFAR
jgi:hypothetical protein